MFGIPKLSLDELRRRAAGRKLRGFYMVENYDYHAGPGWSSSQLKRVLRSPAHAWYAEDETAAKDLGGALHCALLEPERFAKEYVTEPKWELPASIKEGREEREAFWQEVEAEGRDSSSLGRLTHAEGQAIDAVARRAAASATYQSLVRGAQFEMAAYWTDQETGFLCKAKADVWNGRTIADVKTARDASKRRFAGEIAKYDYHLSAAYYCDGFAALLGGSLRFVFIVVEKKPPHGIAFYELDQEGREAGRVAYRKALATLKTHEHAKPADWPCYPDAIQSINLSGYAKTKYEN